MSWDGGIPAEDGSISAREGDIRAQDAHVPTHMEAPRRGMAASRRRTEASRRGMAASWREMARARTARRSAGARRDDLASSMKVPTRRGNVTARDGDIASPDGDIPTRVISSRCGMGTSRRGRKTSPPLLVSEAGGTSELPRASPWGRRESPPRGLARRRSDDAHPSGVDDFFPRRRPNQESLRTDVPYGVQQQGYGRALLRSRSRRISSWHASVTCPARTMRSTHTLVSTTARITPASSAPPAAPQTEARVISASRRRSRGP